MALAKFQLTATVTLTAEAISAVTAGEPGTGGAAGFGNTSTIVPTTADNKYGWLPATLIKGTVIVADSTAGLTAPQLLYQAIGAANLRPYSSGDGATGGIDGVSN